MAAQTRIYTIFNNSTGVSRLVRSTHPSHALKPVAWGVPNTRITEAKPLMQVMIDMPADAQYPELLVPLYAHTPEWREAVIAAADEISARAYSAALAEHHGRDIAARDKHTRVEAEVRARLLALLGSE